MTRMMTRMMARMMARRNSIDHHLLTLKSQHKIRPTVLSRPNFSKVT